MSECNCKPQTDPQIENLLNEFPAKPTYGELKARVRELEEQAGEMRSKIAALTTCNKELDDALSKIDDTDTKAEDLKARLRSCWHVANCYDGNRANACDLIMDLCEPYVRRNNGSRS